MMKKTTTRSKKTRNTAVKNTPVDPTYTKGINILANVRYNLWMGGSNTVDLDLRGGYYLLAALCGKRPEDVTNEVIENMDNICKAKRAGFSKLADL